MRAGRATRIMGIGIDLVTNSHVEKVLEKSYAERFIKKFLHPTELQRYLAMTNDEKKVEFVASRWAVKEALEKAIGKKELTFNQTEIVKDSHGRPKVQIEGDDNSFLFNELQIAECHITITHEKDYTIASAIVEEYA